jgi:polyferredoxin
LVLGFGGYAWFVDLFLAGVLGYGLYFWFSGRMWCRFACPLAALMHVYARFSRFRILAEKKKCISCNVCTSVCHQGINVMRAARPVCCGSARSTGGRARSSAATPRGSPPLR